MRRKITRCKWAEGVNLDYIEYHDKEWGVPVHDDKVQFEFLILEGAQAGLSWSTILNKREGYRQAFADFDVLVAVETDRQNPALCIIVVTVTNPDLEWPQLAGSQVTLHQGDGTSMTQETDPYGEAVFQRIAVSALPHLIIEVKPGL